VYLRHVGQRLAIYGCAEELRACEALDLSHNGGVANLQGDIVLRVLPLMRRILGDSGEGAVPQVGRHPCDPVNDWDDLLMQCLADKYPVPGTGGG